MLGRQNTKKAFQKKKTHLDHYQRLSGKRMVETVGKKELDQHYGNTYVSAEAESNILQKGQGVVENLCVAGSTGEKLSACFHCRISKKKKGSVV